MATPSQSAVAAVDSFAIARELLLEGAGLELAALDRALSTAMVRKLDYVDLYFQLTRYETWTVEDGIVKEGVYSIDQGIGVRADLGRAHGLRLLRSARRSRAARRRRRGARHRAHARRRRAARSRRGAQLSSRSIRAVDPLRSMSDGDKVELLADLDRRVRAMDHASRRSSRASPASTRSCSCRRPTARSRPTCGRSCASTSRSSWRRTAGASRATRAAAAAATSRSSRRRAGRSRSPPKPCARRPSTCEPCRRRPATCPSCSAPGWPGILLHEAIGHGLEGDFNRKGTSAFTGRIGERVATEQCTVVDDGTLVGPPRLADRRRRRHADAAATRSSRAAS